MITTDARIEDLLNRLKASGIGKSVSASEWQEVEDFLIENLITDERIDKEYKMGVVIGKDAELARIRTHLNQKAADHFINGRDREAEQLRSIAKGIAQPEAKP